MATRLSFGRLAPPANAALHVHADLPGFGPATVETKVAIPLEQALATLPAPRDVESRSRYGSADIFLRFAPTVDRDRVLAHARTLIAGNVLSLPPGMTAPTAKFDSTLIPPAAVYAVSAKTMSDDLVHWVTSVLVDPLREVPEIASVTIEGIEQRVIRIQPDPRRLATLGLSFDDLIDAVHRRDLVPRRKSARHQVVTPGSAESIAARAVRLPNGESIALSEVATVSATNGSTTGRLRYRNLPALVLKIYPRTAAEAVIAADRAHAHLAWLRANGLVPHGADIHVLHNEARAIAQWLKHVLQSIGICLAVILAVVGIIFGLRALKRTVLAFAVWLPTSVAVLAGMGYTLNVATTTGVLLATAPFTVMLMSCRAVKDMRRIVFTSVIAWVVGLVLLADGRVTAAFGVGLIVAGLVRWLMTPWLREGTTLGSLGEEEPVARPFRRSSLVASVTAILVLITVGVSVYGLPAVGAGERGGTFTFRLRGSDLQRLTAIVDPLVVSLHVIPHMERIVSSTKQQDTWRLQLDPQRMQAVNVGLVEIGRAFAIARDGLVVGEIANADRRLELRMQLAPGAAGDSFEQLLLRGETADHPAIYLHHVGAAEKVSEPQERVRIDGEPAVEVTALWRGAETRDALQDFCDRVDVPKGYRLDCVIRDSPI